MEERTATTPSHNLTAATRVRIADGAPQRIGSAGAQHMPDEEACLVGEHRSNGERKLSFELTVRHANQGSGWRDQSTMDMRTGPSATQRGIGAGLLRGTILDRTSLACLDVDDCLRLTAVPQACSGGTKKKSLRAAIATQSASSAPGHP